VAGEALGGPQQLDRVEPILSEGPAVLSLTDILNV